MVPRKAFSKAKVYLEIDDSFNVIVFDILAKLNAVRFSEIA